MVRLMPQVAPISPQRRMKRSCEVRSCWAGAALGAVVVAGVGAVSVGGAIASPVSVYTESIAYGEGVSCGFRGFSENENRRLTTPDTEAQRPTRFTAQFQLLGSWA